MKRRSVFLILTLLGLALYANTFQATFHFDDALAILQSKAVKSGPSWGALWDEFNTRAFLGWTFSLNYAFGKLDVFGYHLVNILCHIFSSFLVYELVLLMFQTPSLQQDPLGKTPKRIASLSAFLFLAHPIQTQGVTYIWQRATTLATFFYLASLVLYLRARLSRRFFLYAGSLLATVLGMFTKEITATLPFMLILYEFSLFGPWKEDGRKRVIPLIPFLLTLAIIPLALLRSGEVTSRLMRSPVMANVSEARTLSEVVGDMTSWMISGEMSRKDYTLTQINVLRTYVRLLFFPIRQNLDYDYPLASQMLEPGTFLSFLLHLALWVSAAVLFRRKRLLSLGIFWFYLTLSVESAVVMSDVLFEHRLYLPMVGFSFFAAAVFSLLWKERKAFALAASVVVLSLSAATVHRNAVWRNETTLWEDVVKKSPGKARPHYNLGTAYLHAKEYEKAVKEFQKAVAIHPRYAEAFNNLGVATLHQGDFGKAIQYGERAVQVDPRFVKAYTNLTVAYGKKGEYEKAIASGQKAIQLDPDHADAYNNLAIVSGLKGDFEGAIRYCQKAIQLDPDHADAQNNLGIATLAKKDFKGSLRQVEALRTLNRNDLADQLEGLIDAHQGRASKK